MVSRCQKKILIYNRLGSEVLMFESISIFIKKYSVNLVRQQHTGEDPNFFQSYNTANAKYFYQDIGYNIEVEL
jgi:hypothetical protein